MSFGALSGVAVEALNRGAQLAGCFQNTGEGGLSPYHRKGGDIVFQIGTGYFGCRDEAGAFSLDALRRTLDAGTPVRALEIKLSQGAKPGLGGLLPGVKVTPEIAESLGLDKARGALVAQVSKDAPAERAGIKMGDVIIEFDGKEIKDSNDLPIVVARTPVDRRVRVKVLREKKEMNLSVTIGELKEEEVARRRGRKAPRG
jgi:membrane-associated protease RseP (regulator of RpoE activity)